MPTIDLEALVSENAAYAKVTWRLVPFLFLCYIANYLDRVNVAFAKLQMQSDLGFSDTVYGFGAGVFFLGYFLFEVPSNIIMAKIGPRIWIARIMITWGCVSGAMIFAKSAVIFYVLRFALGLAEAGFFPGIIFYLTFWFPSKRRARTVAWFMMAIAFTGVIGGPLSGWILQSAPRLGGLTNWQMLFLLEAIPSVLIGLLVPFLLPNGIRSATWLSEEEKLVLEKNVQGEEPYKARMPWIQIFAEPKLLLYSLVYFCCAAGNNGVGFWLPQIIKNTGIKDPLNVGLLSAVPYGLAVLGMVLFGRSSDLARERRWHFATTVCLGAIGVVVSGMFIHNTCLAMCGLSMAVIGILSSHPIFWSMPTAVMTGTSAAAAIALINSVGNLGGFVTPYLMGWILDLTKRGDYGLYVIAALLIFGGTLVLVFVPRKFAVDRAD
jgi:D-galactonate transporter